MAEKNGWLLIDVIEPRQMSVVMVGGRVRSGVALSSVVAKNHEQILRAVISCRRSKTTVREKISTSRSVTAIPVVERTHAQVHGVWVCTHQGEEPFATPSPSWAFLWDLAEGFAYRGDGVGMSASWADLGVPVRRQIADTLRVFDMGEHNTAALAGLARKSGSRIDRYTVDEHRPDGDRRVHFVAHSAPEDRIEQIDAEKLVLFNDRLAAAGNEQILSGTVALEYRTDGSVVGYLADGTTYERSAAALENNPLLRTGIVDEIKRTVAACLGVSLTATGFWASIEAELTSWDRAAKFLVRRLGVLGAVSCAGGIIWEYI